MFHNSQQTIQFTRVIRAASKADTKTVGFISSQLSNLKAHLKEDEYCLRKDTQERTEPTSR